MRRALLRMARSVAVNCVFLERSNDNSFQLRGNSMSPLGVMDALSTSIIVLAKATAFFSRISCAPLIASFLEAMRSDALLTKWCSSSARGSLVAGWKPLGISGLVASSLLFSARRGRASAGSEVAPLSVRQARDRFPHEAASPECA